MRKPLALLLAMLLPLSCSAETADTYRFGDPEVRKIAITVDDCRNMAVLESMLDLFKEEGISATFFVIGNALKEKDSALWQRVVAEGHEIGNHTYSHADLSHRNRRAILWQLRETEETLDRVLGFSYQMRVMRPPYGRVAIRGTLGPILEAGYERVILWSVSQTDPDTAFAQIKNGSVCLYHTNPKDLRCLQKLIPRLKAEGYEMVTVSELFGFEAPGPSAPTSPPQGPASGRPTSTPGAAGP
ncbi:MAG: polysaccharide deacetylase family protein [Candidatus Limiplasma sp.]|nr:polysaccharide deacetylase family protein [Candidatus Limiplasma sp.]